MAYMSSSFVSSLAKAYDETSLVDIERYQLDRLNALWRRAIEGLTRYRRLVAERKLPERFDSISEYRTCVPPLSRGEVQEQVAACSWQDPRPDRFRTTGGSTAAPLQMPAWQSEFKATNPDIWVARGWYGIEPRDRLFLFWGHSHLLGSGWRGWINGKLRRVKDALQNYVRHSCYDLNEEALERAGQHILESRPDYIIGYGYSLDRLARVNASRRDAFRSLQLKAVIGAAEAFPFADTVDLLKDVFGCAVGMEYGSVETGLMAHTTPEGGYRVFWRNYLLEWDAAKSDGAQEVHVTSLYERCTPLFRYAIGDAVAADGVRSVAGECSLVRFERVLGRSNKPVRLPSQRTLHSETVSHIVRDQRAVRGYQFVCAEGGVVLRVVLQAGSNCELSADATKLIYDKARRIDAELANTMRIEVVNSLDQSTAGKHPMVIYQ
jgi:phenylacetate-coenzyme A ligase PaaK-like adenylate-forming protein